MANLLGCGLHMNQLQQIWLCLTGGEQGCPRGRFALTMLVAYGLYHLSLPLFVHCYTTLEIHTSIPLLGSLIIMAGALLAFVGILLAFLPFAPLALLGSELVFYNAYRLMKDSPEPTSAAPEALWLYWLGFIVASLSLLLAGSVAFGSAWRRLKDTGCSPFYLLLGLTYLLGLGSSGFVADAAGIYLLGPLWLIILFSQPGRPRAAFELFRPMPEKSGD